MQTTANTSAVSSRACVFELGGRTFAVEGVYSRQFVRIEHLTTVPQGPRALAGLFNVRGQVRPLVNLNSTFGLPSSNTRFELAALLECRGNIFAVTVDRIVGFSVIEPGSLQAITSEADQAVRAHAKGTVRLEGREAVLLDLERILDSVRADQLHVAIRAA